MWKNTEPSRKVTLAQAPRRFSLFCSSFTVCAAEAGLETGCYLYEVRHLRRQTQYGSWNWGKSFFNPLFRSANGLCQEILEAHQNPWPPALLFTWFGHIHEGCFESLRQGLAIQPWLAWDFLCRLGMASNPLRSACLCLLVNGIKVCGIVPGFAWVFFKPDTTLLLVWPIKPLLSASFSFLPGQLGWLPG